MLRAVLRIVLLLIIVAAVAAFFLGYRMTERQQAREHEPVVGTSGEAVDVDRAREAGARVGETVADSANEVQRRAADAALVAKIKSKMALDDMISARDINVDVRDGVVTLKGSVGTEQQQQRAVQLARETEGVVSIDDRLAIR
jgi:osmotically-inducible protein OsmY